MGLLARSVEQTNCKDKNPYIYFLNTTYELQPNKSTAVSSQGAGARGRSSRGCCDVLVGRLNKTGKAESAESALYVVLLVVQFTLHGVDLSASGR